MAIADRSPAPPPPTSSTSWAAAAPSLTTKLLVQQDPPGVRPDLPEHAAVVELYTPGDDATGVGVTCLQSRLAISSGLVGCGRRNGCRPAVRHLPQGECYRRGGNQPG